MPTGFTTFDSRVFNISWGTLDSVYSVNSIDIDDFLDDRVNLARVGHFVGDPPEVSDVEFPVAVTKARHNAGGSQLRWGLGVVDEAQRHTMGVGTGGIDGAPEAAQR